VANFTLKNKKGKLILTATSLASGMSVFTGASVSIALPTIQTHFSADIDKIQWVVNGFLLALSALILISGALCDQYGRKKLFLYGIAIFIFGSFLSTLSANINQLIFFQALQGVGAALMISASLAIINSCFAFEQRGKVIGHWAGISGIMAAAGTFLGGWLVNAFNWHSVFYFSVPLGVLVFFIVFKYVPESSNPVKRKLNLASTVLLALALAGIIFGLTQGPTAGWNSSSAIFAFVLGAVSLTSFIIYERRTKTPLVPLEIFKNRMVLGANFATLTLYFALSGMIFFLVFNLQKVQGYSPYEVGLIFLPATILIATLGGLAGGLTDRIGPRAQLIFGPLVVAGGMSILAMSPAMFGIEYIYLVLTSLILYGLGMSFVIAPITKTALNVKETLSGIASGINNFAARVAILLAISISGAVVVSIFSFHLEKGLASTELTHQQMEQILQQKNKLVAIEIPYNFSEQDAQVTKQVIQDSFMRGFQIAMLINVFLAVSASMISYFTIYNSKKTYVSN
jgi:EmrB/QacA subfamily drug resistance transporter